MHRLTKMRRLVYTGALWQDSAVAAELWDLLLQPDLLIEITQGKPPFAVTIGVPHHAGPGVERIAETWPNPKTSSLGRTADENTALPGLVLFSALGEKGIPCKLVIAAHPTDHDPNKTPESPYWQAVFGDAPGLLFELHGAARHRRCALELSAGMNNIAAPLIFGKALAYFYHGEGVLACQDRPGSRDAYLYHHQVQSSGRLQNPALETDSLAYAGRLGIPALHLEMKPVFRRPDLAQPGVICPSPEAWQLCRALANTLQMLNRSDDVQISAASLGLAHSAFLIRPSMDYEASYLRAIAETPFEEQSENPELRVNSHEEFAALVNKTRRVDFSALPEHPPEEYLWLIDQGEFIGRVYFLHWLNEYRLQTDGQVDYWIGPSMRGRGYGRLILLLLLERFRQLGLERVLISCRSDNLLSQKVIQANGGVFEKEIILPDGVGAPHRRMRYWINLDHA